MKLKNCNKSSLIAHQNSIKRTKNFSAKKKTVNIEQFFKAKSEPDLSDKIARAGLLLSSFMAEHGTPFSQADHLTEVMKKMFPDSNIAKVSQVPALMVRFYDGHKLKVVDVLLDTVEVEDASASGLYNTVKEVFESRQIPMRNILGFASDNCFTMLGARNGFQAFLKKDVPSVLVLGCVCHSFALCSSYASNKLPSWLESFIKDVCCYFARSSKRQHQFRLIQEVVDSPRHRMVKLSQTRWLSRGRVISIVEQWDALKLFFQGEATTDKVDGAGNISKAMMTRGTKHMLLFFNYILGKIDRMNVEFQAEYFKLGTLFATISDEYRSILSLFIKDSVIKSQKLAAIDPQNRNLLKNLSDINLGGRCEGLLVSEPLEEKERRFRIDCLSYMVELCMQIKRRFTFEEDSVLSLLQIIEPKAALSSERCIKSIAKLAVHFPHVIKNEDLDELEEQWRDLLYAQTSLKNLSYRATTFWYELRSVKDGNGHSKFDLLSKFMCCLFALPHSSACVERVFSQVNLIKTKQTNRLQVATAANCLLAKQSIATGNRQILS
ncbi:hypothetical protein Pcinc_007425 [Petrolisthes cinctipes]|uniref:HAT C-terminal dimerisation domain-containing protein n=1 Tax=Petrolisthes cinctipes TaxID=88211 RepID=A0AAE1GFD0_PETCI|nr:hypothetical protein Pcinc_007425 [Petrolisthes cinctipes]